MKLTKGCIYLSFSSILATPLRQLAYYLTSFRPSSLVKNAEQNNENSYQPIDQSVPISFKTYYNAALYGFDKRIWTPFSIAHLLSSHNQSSRISSLKALIPIPAIAIGPQTPRQGKFSWSSLIICALAVHYNQGSLDPLSRKKSLVT